MTWRFIPHVSLACQKGKCNECLFFTLLLLLQGSSQNGSGGGHYYRDSRDRERPPTKSPSSDHDLDNISDLSVSKSKLHISQKYGKNSKIWGEKKLKTLRSVGLWPPSLRFRQEDKSWQEVTLDPRLLQLHYYCQHHPNPI